MIPKGWGKGTFRQLCTIREGQVSPLESPYCDHIYIGPEHIESGTGRILELVTAKEQGVISGKYLFDEHAIVYSKVRPNLNKVCFPRLVGICSADAYPVWPKNALDVEYLVQYMLSDHFLKQVVASSLRTGMPKVNRSDLNCVSILYPPVELQKRIVSILKAYDQAIEITNNMICAKERRRQALAQRLLLREAHVAHWPAAPLGDYFARVRRKNAVSCQRVLTASGRQGLVDQEKYFNKCVAGKNLSNYTRLVRGEFAYNRSAMTGYPCGAVKRLSDFDEGVVSPLYICLGLDHSRGDSDFFCHYFESGILDRELSRIVQVGARSHGMLNISATDLLALDVRVPSLPRQREIAAILNDADREIALHRAELDALKRQKRGLMQQLLTGKVRVP